MGPERPNIHAAVQREVPETFPGVPFPGKTVPKDLGPKKRRGWEELSARTRLLIATAGTLAVLGGVGYGAYQTIPRVLNAIESIIGGESIEEKFPIKLDHSSFTPVTPEEEKKLWENTKTLDLENHTFTTGFPFDQATIDRNPNLRMDQQFDAILPPFIDGDKLKQEGVKNVRSYTGLQKGEDFKLIYDPEKLDASVIFMYKAGVTQGVQGNSFLPAYTGYLVTFRDKKTGEITKKGIAGLYAEPLIQTKPFPTDHHQVYEDGTPIKSGDPIMRTTTDLQDWDGKTGEILPGQKGQFVESTSFEQQNPMAPIPLTANSLRTSDGNIATSSQTPKDAISTR